MRQQVVASIAFALVGFILGFTTCEQLVRRFAREAAAEGAIHALFMASGTVCLEIVNTPTGGGIRVIKCP